MMSAPPFPKMYVVPAAERRKWRRDVSGSWEWVGGQSLRTPELGHRASARNPTEATNPVTPGAQERACVCIYLIRNASFNYSNTGKAEGVARERLQGEPDSKNVL